MPEYSPTMTSGSSWAMASNGYPSVSSSTSAHTAAIRSTSLEDAIEIARRTEAAALAVDRRIANSEGATVSSHDSDFVLANTLGFCAGYPASKSSISVSVVAEDAGGMQRDYWYTSHRDPSRLDDAEVVGRIEQRVELVQYGFSPLRRTPIHAAAQQELVTRCDPTGEYLQQTGAADTITGDDNGNWLWGSSSLYDPGSGTIQSTTNNDTISAGGGNDLVGAYDALKEFLTPVAPGDVLTTIDTLTGVLTDGTARHELADFASRRPAFGKTGTQDNNTNAWFVGGTKQLATAVWVGDPRGGSSLPSRGVRALPALRSLDAGARARDPRAS